MAFRLTKLLNHFMPRSQDLAECRDFGALVRTTSGKEITEKGRETMPIVRILVTIREFHPRLVQNRMPNTKESKSYNAP